MPDPKPKEPRNKFISRCVPIVLAEPGTKSTAHAVAKCGGIWDQAHKKGATNVTGNLVVSRIGAFCRRGGAALSGGSQVSNQARVGNPLRADPTRTATLRRIFMEDLNRRFARLKRSIRQLVVVEDAFGLRQRRPLTLSEERDYGPDTVQNSRGTVGGVDCLASADQSAFRTNASEVFGGSNGSGPSGSSGEHIRRPPLTAHTRWAFHTDPQKVEAFQGWLKTQVDAEILAAQQAVEQGYWQAYVEEGYRKGAGRAFDDTNKARRAVAGSTEQMAFYEGSKEQFLASAFAQPVAIDKVKLLAGRVFTELKGVTEDMSTKITRNLTDGLVQGMNPREIARRMIKDGIGTKVRGIQSRALTIARTEVIRAHAEGQLDAMERMGVTKVGVMVEWSTAGDDRVCPACEELNGVVLDIKEARGIIPRHPNCRCAHIPANVGESTKGQIRGKAKIQKAMDDSIRTEMPRIKKRTLAEQKARSSWAGADKTIAKRRPRSILEPKPAPKVKPLSPVESPREWARSRFQPMTLVGEGDRPATITELRVLADSFRKIPKELRKQVSRAARLKVAITPEGTLARAQAPGLFLDRGSSLSKFAEAIRQHELRHALINQPLLGKVDPVRLWSDLSKLDIPLPIHVNQMYVRGGRSAYHGVDEFMAVIGDRYKSGMTVAEQIDSLIHGGLRLDIEKVAGSLQTDFAGMVAWRKDEAEKAVLLWRKWMKIEAKVPLPKPLLPKPAPRAKPRPVPRPIAPRMRVEPKKARLPVPTIERPAGLTPKMAAKMPRKELYARLNGLPDDDLLRVERLTELTSSLTAKQETRVLERYWRLREERAFWGVKPGKPTLVKRRKTKDFGETIQLNIPNKRIENGVTEGVESIGKVHKVDVGLKDRVSVDLLPSEKAAEGQFFSKRVENRLVARRIAISADSGSPALTSVHEAGHMIDLVGLQDDLLSSEYSNLMLKIKRSEAVQHLRGAVTKLEAGVRADAKYVSYLLRDEELFARAYAQYIARKSGSARLQEQLVNRLVDPRKGSLAEVARESPKFLSKYSSQWYPKDFDPIEEAFDVLFKAKGWL